MRGYNSRQNFLLILWRVNVILVITTLDIIMVKNMAVTGIKFEFRGTDLVDVILMFHYKTNVLERQKGKIHTKQCERRKAFPYIFDVYFTFHVAKIA